MTDEPVQDAEFEDVTGRDAHPPELPEDHKPAGPTRRELLIQNIRIVEGLLDSAFKKPNKPVIVTLPVSVKTKKHTSLRSLQDAVLQHRRAFDSVHNQRLSRLKRATNDSAVSSGLGTELKRADRQERADLSRANLKSIASDQRDSRVVSIRAHTDSKIEQSVGNHVDSLNTSVTDFVRGMKATARPDLLAYLKAYGEAMDRKIQIHVADEEEPQEITVREALAKIESWEESVELEPHQGLPRLKSKYAGVLAKDDRLEKSLPFVRQFDEANEPAKVLEIRAEVVDQIPLLSAKDFPLIGRSYNEPLRARYFGRNKTAEDLKEESKTSLTSVFPAIEEQRAYVLKAGIMAASDEFLRATRKMPKRFMAQRSAIQAALSELETIVPLDADDSEALPSQMKSLEVIARKLHTEIASAGQKGFSGIDENLKLKLERLQSVLGSAKAWSDEHEMVESLVELVRKSHEPRGFVSPIGRTLQQKWAEMDRKQAKTLVLAALNAFGNSPENLERFPIRTLIDVEHVFEQASSDTVVAREMVAVGMRPIIGDVKNLPSLQRQMATVRLFRMLQEVEGIQQDLTLQAA